MKDRAERTSALVRETGQVTSGSVLRAVCTALVRPLVRVADQRSSDAVAEARRAALLRRLVRVADQECLGAGG